MEREIVLDTETTGLSPKDGHRIIEIGCVELRNKLPTGNVFHYYINPERDVPEDAFRIHGIATDFLKDKPKFSDIADDFINFIADSKLVIHNADFDVRFLNAELTWIKKKEIPKDQYFCTYRFSRAKFPGAQVSLNALCKRFNVDLSERNYHGALLDARLLADVYLELMGGVQVGIDLQSKQLKSNDNFAKVEKTNNLKFRESRNFVPTEEEIKKHEELVSKIAKSLWN